MTTPRRLTTSRIETTNASAKEVWLSDNDGSRGEGRLLVRVRSKSRRFYFRISIAKTIHVIPLGRYNRTRLEGYLTLLQARDMARHWSSCLRLGSDDVPRTSASGMGVLFPKHPRPTPSEIRSSTRGRTVCDLCEAYAAFVKANRSAAYAVACRDDTKNYIASSAVSKLPANRLSSRDAAALLRDIAERCSSDKANRIRSLLMAAYNLALASATDPNVNVDFSLFAIQANPISTIKRLRTTSQPQDRALASKELGQFWRHLTRERNADSLQYRFIRLTILLGGQRCVQLLRARTTDVNIDSATIKLLDSKGSRKTPRIHVLPLTTIAMTEIGPLLEECKALQTPHLFPSDRTDCPITDQVLSNTVKRISQAMLDKKVIEAPFCYRDIRRTIETRMSDLGISKELRAQIQSHDLGGIQMVHYNRFDFLEQKRRALQQWEQYVLDCAAKAASTDA
jgi:integrase